MFLFFRKMMFPMEIFGDQSMTLVDEAMAKDRLIGLVMSKKSPRKQNISRKISCDRHELRDPENG